MSRQWAATPAKRSHVPLLVGLMGPSGGGKTFSALRLASGMQKVVGGEIFGVDTESGRMLHYADRFTFQHVPFKPPFGSADYEEVMKWCVGQGAKTIVIDSMTHEHAGEGGYIEFHEAELTRLAGADASQHERDKRNLQAWIKPSAARQKLIRTMLQLDANFIFTFRAKEKVKPGPGGKFIEMGFMPIAGEEFLFEMTVCCLLMPVAGGVPTWQSAQPGEAMMIKKAEQFEGLFRNYGIGQQEALSERHGEGLALWARGTTAAALPPPQEDRPPPAADWDHAAWAATFATTLGELKTVADFDAVWNDESNRGLFADLKVRDEAAARTLYAAATGKRKALASKEKAATDGF